MIAEATCIGKPFAIIPLVVTEVQDVIAAGQLRPSDQLIDVQQIATPGTVHRALLRTAAAGRPSAYRQAAVASRLPIQTIMMRLPTRISVRSDGRSYMLWIPSAYAMILRMQAMLLPVQTLVLSGQ